MKPLTQQRGYAVVFVFVLAGLCATALTFVHTRLARRVQANREYDRIAAIVRVLELAGTDTPRDQIIETWDRAIQPIQVGPLELFEARVNGVVVGYAIEFAGDGVYGPIRGVVALGPDRRNIRDMVVYEQHESAGLGARIADRPFLDQFAGKSVIQPLTLSKGTRAGQNIDIDAIGGATKTANRLEQILNTRLAPLRQANPAP